MEPDTTEHSQDAQSLDAQSQVSSANQVKVTADEVNKIMQAANINQPDADKLLAASRGEFVAGISDPNDPKWVKGIETRDSVNQNQQESERNDQKAEQNSSNALQNEPKTKQPEPEEQQEPEKVCTACGQTGGGNCPDCGVVMGDATYQKHSMKRIRLKFRKMIRRKWKALNIHTRRTLAAISITIAIMKLARRQIP